MNTVGYGRDDVRNRVSSLLSSRLSRGFIFIEGIDDGESECGLDEYDHFDVTVQVR